MVFFLYYTELINKNKKVLENENKTIINNIMSEIYLLQQNYMKI